MSNFATTVLKAARLFVTFFEYVCIKEEQGNPFMSSVIFSYSRVAPRLGLEHAIKHCTASALKSQKLHFLCLLFENSAGNSRKAWKES